MNAHLEPGDSREVEVDPALPYVPTGLLVVTGERYVFAAGGRWKDGWLPACGPDGWRGGFLERWNRLPRQPFFLLCGTLDEGDGRAFGIGRGREWTVPAGPAGGAEARLFLFANDWPSRYANNHALPAARGGPLRVRIGRLA